MECAAWHAHAVHRCASSGATCTCTRTHHAPRSGVPHAAGSEAGLVPACDQQTPWFARVTVVPPSGSCVLDLGRNSRNLEKAKFRQFSCVKGPWAGAGHYTPATARLGEPGQVQELWRSVAITEAVLGGADRTPLGPFVTPHERGTRSTSCGPKFESLTRATRLGPFAIGLQEPPQTRACPSWLHAPPRPGWAFPSRTRRFRRIR